MTAMIERETHEFPVPSLVEGTGEYNPPHERPEVPFPPLSDRWVSVYELRIELIARGDLPDGVRYWCDNARTRRRWVASWIWIALAAVVVPLALALTAVWANSVVDAAPVSHTPPAAPTTGPTPSPLGLSVVEDSPAALVAGLLDVHGGGAV